MTAYAEADLWDAFKRVRNPADCNGRIDSVIERGRLDATIAAIRFYTGTPPTVSPLDNGRVCIRAAGFRDGPYGS